MSVVKRYTINFADGLAGWSGGFADYPVGQEEFYELESGWQALPEGLPGNGLFISGNNHSDDLFMFIKGPIDGLKASTPYSLTFKITLATNAPTGCFGIGGAPGESVFLKAGATRVEPEPVMAETNYQMNIDKGNQSQGGTDALVLGNIANSNTDCTNPIYQIKVLQTDAASFQVKTDEGGSLWILVGTDSGYEGITSLYYTQLEIVAIEAK